MNSAFWAIFSKTKLLKNIIVIKRNQTIKKGDFFLNWNISIWFWLKLEYAWMDKRIAVFLICYWGFGYITIKYLTLFIIIFFIILCVNINFKNLLFECMKTKLLFISHNFLFYFIFSIFISIIMVCSTCI